MKVFEKLDDEREDIEQWVEEVSGPASIERKAYLEGFMCAYEIVNSYLPPRSELRKINEVNCRKNQ